MKVTVASRSGKVLTSLENMSPNSTIKEVQNELFLASMLNWVIRRL